MKRFSQRLFAKILVIPAAFSFIFSCCQPTLAQAAQPNDDHVRVQVENVLSIDGLTVEEGHHCEHTERTQAITQSSTKTTTIDLSFGLPSFIAVSNQHLSIADHFTALPRITGPPWDGKSIKAFLGVYRS